jgi:hypothetical protein
MHFKYKIQKNIRLATKINLYTSTVPAPLIARGIVAVAIAPETSCSISDQQMLVLVVHHFRPLGRIVFFSHWYESFAHTGTADGV